MAPNCDANHVDSESEKARIEWATLLSPHLTHALSASGSYAQDTIKAHETFFRDHVCGWLGREPSSSPLRPAYPSALTCDATPLELSYSWNGRTSVAVRYVVDLIPLDGALTRSASLAAALRTINGLREMEPTEGYRVEMLPNVWMEVTARLAHWEHTVHPLSAADSAAPTTVTCELCSPSSTFVGFDLTSSGARGKLYWLLPACLSSQRLLDLLDDVFALLPADIHAHWGQVRQYLASQASSVMRPRMLCIDATRYPAPRIKLYSRFYFDSHASFAAVEPYLTMDGAAPLPPQSHYATLWAHMQAKYRLDPQPQSRYCMVVYDILPLQLRSKLYWFAHQMPCNDGAIIKHVLADFAQPTALLRGQVEAGHMSDETAFIREIGVAHQGDAFDIAAYVSPALFSA